MRFQRNLHISFPLLLAAMLSGCLGSNHLLSSDDQVEDLTGRDQHQIYPAFYADPPTCVVVLPGDGVSNFARAEQIEGAISRQLSSRIGRVIHPRERRRLVRSMAVDLRHRLDARQFATAANCSALLRWSILDIGNNYTPVWSQKRLAIQTELIRAQEGTILWRATATVARSSGDPPLSLLSLPFAAYKTARFQADEDAMASMIDDLARHLLANLPDVGE